MTTDPIAWIKWLDKTTDETEAAELLAAHDAPGPKPLDADALADKVLAEAPSWLKGPH